MIFRLAKMSELYEIENMFKDIIEDMYKQNIKIWNEFYPTECFEDDIKNNQLYVLEDNNNIVAVTALINTTEGAEEFNWKDKDNKSLYIARLGVNIKFKKQGYGSKLLDNIKQEAKRLDAKYIRLCVADCNIPAINYYQKNAFVKQDGIFVERINETTKLTQYGMEYKL